MSESRCLDCGKPGKWLGFLVHTLLPFVLAVWFLAGVFLLVVLWPWGALVSWVGWFIAAFVLLPVLSRVHGWQPYSGAVEDHSLPMFPNDPSKFLIRYVVGEPMWVIVLGFVMAVLFVVGIALFVLEVLQREVLR